MFAIFENFPVSVKVVGYEIKRYHIENNDKKPFLAFWNIERIKKAGRLPDLFNKVVFAVGGYDADERELCEIPEVRTFLRDLTSEWPYFFFADNLETQFLDQLIRCMVPNIIVKSDDKNPNRYLAKINPDEANAAYHLLLKGLVKIAPMDSTMNQARFDSRVEAVQQCLRREVIG